MSRQIPAAHGDGRVDATVGLAPVCRLRLRLRHAIDPVHSPGRRITSARWDELADRLRANKGRLGDLGGGNHFLDALMPYGEGSLHFLVHTGSRDESGHADQFVDQPARFDAEFKRVVGWAEQNRAQIHKEIDAVFGRTELVLDLCVSRFG